MEKPPNKAARRLQALAPAGCNPKQWPCLGSHLGTDEIAKVRKKAIISPHGMRNKNINNIKFFTKKQNDYESIEIFGHGRRYNTGIYGL